MSDNSEFYGFGSGDLFMVPVTGSDMTPVKFSLQDFELDIKFETKTLHGRKAFPLKVARGKGTVGGKFKSATVNGAAYNRCFFGDSASVSGTGQLVTVPSEVLTFAQGQVTSAVANHGAFQLDLGLHRVDTARALTKANSAGSVVAGSYYCDGAGNYTLNATDVAGGIVAAYTYMSTTGTTTTIANTAMGSGPQSKLIYSTAYAGSQVTLQLNMSQLVDLKLAVKNDDFMIPEQSYQAFADITDTIGMISFGA